MFQKFRTHFLSGLLVIGPLYLTILVITYLVRLTDNSIVNPLFEILPVRFDASFKVVFAKTMIAVFVILFIAVIGVLAEKFLFKRLFMAIDTFIKGIPFLSIIYNSIKEIAQALIGGRRGIFQKVVFVEYPRKGVYTIAFVTNDKRWEVDEKTGKITRSIFIPTPPNPATGYILFVPEEELIESDMTIEEAVRLVISVGAAIPPPRKKAALPG
jgi:uncharacterized membrane protein